jgi:FdhD protein
MASDKGVTERKIVRVGPRVERLDDAIAVEEPLEIRVAGDSVAITMRTPGDDRDLALGFLFSEGIVRGAEDVGAIAHCGHPGEEGYGNVIEVTAAPGVMLEVEKVQASRRGTLTTSACGVCGRKSVDDLLGLCGKVGFDSLRVSAEFISRAPEVLRSRQTNFARTGGVHAAVALDETGAPLATAEDVGRHNAVDKVIGKLIRQDRVGLHAQGRPVLLAVSGRASFEILQKATVARIPIVTSVSAASSLAVDLAEKSGITLATFVRGGGFNLCTHPERVSLTAPG